MFTGDIKIIYIITKTFEYEYILCNFIYQYNIYLLYQPANFIRRSTNE